ncbi:hypothetical protein GCM10010977_21020 [Citricoccus zhacaiensis]|uniref:HTTM-like domain-containing protein n=1 Tax=Citricoccus zhacaiensis TaxID=489142 RepID=A0ABQ2M3H1_9MICC|nr:HTTM domain-containing protein [Citricoccus zhacaiensis]GGO46322.1 hypothetical protein GCM10010977_21020 [Citricoccus zhacaiensis]
MALTTTKQDQTSSHQPASAASTDTPEAQPAPSVSAWFRRHRNAPANLFNWILDWFLLNRHADYGLAVMRIASGTLLVGWLVFNLPIASRIWGPGSAYWDEYREILGYQWPLDILRDAGPGLFWAWYLIAIALAVAFVLGWRTRAVTPLLFIFYTAINAQNTPISDGGNYFIRIMLIYLIFADISRRWSLDSRRRRKKGLGETQTGTVLHNLALVLVVGQLCLVYLEAGLYKVQGSLWQDGTAIYYPVQSEAYGVFPWLADLLTFSSWAVVLVTYFTVIVQIAFPFLLFHRVTRRIALVSILAMHLGIAVVMGLPFFSGIMASADAVLVSGATWVTIAAWGRARFSGLRARLGAKAPGKRSTTHGQHHPADSESVSV